MNAIIIDVPAERHDECLEVLRASFATDVAEFGLTAENTPHNPAFWRPGDVGRLVARPTELLAVEVEQRIVGCAFVGASRRMPGSWILRHLAVLPEARRRGFGEALIDEAARRARRGGARALRIGIVAENQRLSQWYQRLGFVRVAAGMQFPGLVFTVDNLELALTAGEAESS